MKQQLRYRVCAVDSGHVGPITGRGARQAAVLFCSPQGPAYGWVDLNYLDQLHDRGFEVDYTDQLEDVTWTAIRHYNAW